jgi:hypothetical protein
MSERVGPVAQAFIDARSITGTTEGVVANLYALDFDELTLQRLVQEVLSDYLRGNHTFTMTKKPLVQLVPCNNNSVGSLSQWQLQGYFMPDAGRLPYLLLGLAALFS